MKGRSCLIAYVLTHVALFANASGTTQPPGLPFIENRNQWDASIDYGVKVPGGNLFVKAGGFEIYLYDQDRLDALHEESHHFSEASGTPYSDEKINALYLQVSMVGANRVSHPLPFGKLKTYYNFFVGNDPDRWAGKASSYEGMIYPSIYEGVDMKVYSAGNSLKYDFIVAPAADPSQIGIHYTGAQKLSFDRGDVHILTSLGELIEKNPVAWQIINGVKTYVKCEYVIALGTLHFKFPDGFDACEELYVDPLLIFSTYSGSKADNWGSTATPGEHGNLYSSGVTNQFVGDQLSGPFPATPGAFQLEYGGQYDIAILKYDSAGDDLLYASYLGGSASESPHSLVMTKNEELLVLGTTSSPDFPTTENAYDRTYNGGEPVVHVVNYDNGSDIIVARISKDGSKLLGSTFIGGSVNDGLNPNQSPLTRNYGDQLRGDIISDTDGSIYISTVTSSSDFPALNSFDTTYNGGQTDAVVMRLKKDLSEILWSGFIGGSSADASHTLQLSGSNIYVAGGTASADFPVTAGTYQTVYAGNADGWIAELKKNGSAITRSTLTGTSGFDQVYFLDLSSAGNVYVYGQTTGDFPVSPGIYVDEHSGQFVQEFKPDLTETIFSTVFGSQRGIPDISPTAFLVNECDNIYMAGWGGLVNSGLGYWQSDTRGLPVTNDAYQQSTSGSDFYFIVLSGDAKQLLYATYLGGTLSRTHIDGGTCRFDKSGIVYHAVCSGCEAFNPSNGPSSDFPTTPGAWSAVNKSLNCNNAAFKFDLSSLKARIQPNSVDLENPGLTIFCFPNPVVFQNLSTGGEIYQWDLGDGTVFQKTEQDTILHAYANEGQYLVKLKAIDAHTCVGVDSTQVLINVSELNPVVQPDDDVCFGETYQLHASGGVHTFWRELGGDFVSDDQDPFVSPTDTTQYEVTLMATYGCTFKDTVTLNVIPPVDLTYNYELLTDCSTRPRIQMKRTAIDSTGEALYYFDYGDGTGITPDEIHNYAADGTYAVKIIGTRRACTYDRQIEVPIHTLRVPNVITPEESPGVNDEFQVLFGGADGAAGFQPYDLGFSVGVTIYNRWGRTVFSSSDYHNDWAGKNLAAGVYYYQVTVSGNGSCKGWLHVMK